MSEKQYKSTKGVSEEVFLQTKQQNKLLIEATVDTGLEEIAQKEIREKFDLSASDVHISRGRIYFKCNYNDKNKISSLRSVENLTLIVDVVNLKFENDLDRDLKTISSIASGVEISRFLEAWAAITGFSGTLYPAGPLPKLKDIPVTDIERLGDVLKFRVTCVRSNEHAFCSAQAAAAFGGILNDRFHWPVTMKLFDLEILLYVTAECVITAFKLTTGSLHKRNIAHTGRCTLKATVCYAMLRLAAPRPGEVFLDPLCGGGSIPIEAATAYKDLMIMAGDIDEMSVHRCKLNSEDNPELSLCPDVFYWDATGLPLRTSCIDAVVTDLPFGKRCGNWKTNVALFPKLLAEFARVTKPNTGRAVLLTKDRRAVIEAMRSVSKLWLVQKQMNVKMGNFKACMTVMRRSKGVVLNNNN